MKKFAVYILYSSTLGKYYVGSTNDLARRLNEHNRKKGKYTDAGIPWELKWHTSFNTISEARQYELHIKRQKSRHFIEELINIKK